MLRAGAEALILLLLTSGSPAESKVEVPAGRWMMGSSSDEPDRDPDEGPRVEVDLGAFSIDVTPVTVAAFEARIAELRRADAEAQFWTEADTPAGWLGKCNLGSSRKDHPANCVSFRAARAFCRLANMDLPTEAEWERATNARGRRFVWGSKLDTTRVVSSVDCRRRGCRGGTAPVVRAGPRCNDLGVCDASGNVWQWTITSYAEHLGPYVATTSTTTPSRPVMKGGSWLNEQPKIFRIAHRGLYYPEHGLTGVGFRCVTRN